MEKKQPGDLVQVAFIHNGRQVETRICARSDAQRLGKKMVRAYSPVFRGRYVIKEPGTFIVPASQQQRRLTVAPKQPTVTEVPHYFVEVT